MWTVCKKKKTKVRDFTRSRRRYTWLIYIFMRVNSVMDGGPSVDIASEQITHANTQCQKA